MLAMNSPEVYQENHLFEGPNGQLFRSLTYVNGAEHLYRVDEITGKQTPISKNAMLTLHEAEQAVEDSATSTSINPYTAYLIPTQDPTSIGLSVIEPAGKHVRVDIPSLGRKTEAKTSTEQPPKPDVAPQGMTPAGAIEPGALTLLSLAVVAKGGRGGLSSLWARAHSAYDGYFKTPDPERNRKREIRTTIGAVVLAAAVLLGASYCAEQQDDNKNTTPAATASATPSASPSSEAPGTGEGTTKPGVDDNGSGKDSSLAQSPEGNSPAFATLKQDETVWVTAHDLLEDRGFSHGNANTDAIKDAMLERMNVTEAQAHFLAVNTKVPVFDDDEIEDILDNFSNTKPYKIK